VDGSARACSSSASVALLALDRDQRLPVGAAQQSWREPVLWLASVISARGAPDAVPGALERQPLLRQPFLVDRLELGDRAGSGATPGGLTAARNASPAARSSRRPPSAWHAVSAP
jgi:hypothetical protein